jgi:hypothetical protein
MLQEYHLHASGSMACDLKIKLFHLKAINGSRKA